MEMVKMISVLRILAFLALVIGFKAAEEYDYTGARGPSHWGDLKEEWKTCGDGRQQSPIDVLKRNIEISPNLGELQTSYKEANASLKNNGHDVMLRWAKGAGSIQVDGVNFTLRQCHWHSPAEHLIGGTRYPLEIHMVHQPADNKTVVIGILYKYGKPDTFLAQVLPFISEAEESLGMIDPKHIKFGSRKYYTYTGSFTTPPCTEGVTWIIIHKVRSVSRDQVRNLIAAVHDGFGKNARPIQSENGRTIELYMPQHGASKHI
ncbi:alpha carbonic anhydrase 7-like [Cryptomeria japonica]|uniref:alpha carbonic anhydrase 7-like n=1 Tax=Cryptomeria japonica TaxID=3369 RepID=UPI0027DA7529|nr:alpha carbonic anhydrase 7-like [Cryptomeria japonica]